MGDYVVIRAEFISDSREARRYYEERLAGTHDVSCHGRKVSIFFARGMNHIYTKGRADEPEEMVIRRRVSPGFFDERIWCQDRSRLMDSVIPAICYFTFSLPGTGNRPGHRLLHGPRLKDGRYLRVVLGPGPHGSWLCKTAYPIDKARWMEARKARSVRFPP